MIGNKMEQDFRKIDLHIHTPASKCYKGPTNDEEYLKIIESAIKRKIEIISITDHNTVDGYKKIFSIKDELLKRKNNLSEITDSKQSKSQVTEIIKKIELYSKVLILPGIEIEVNPGIHILVIFNNEIDVDQIDKFLFEGGYSSKDMQGMEDPTFPAQWDVLDLYEASKKYDCILIDPHTDSNKGILNTTQKGNYRAECFRSERLVGVCYKSESQKDKLYNTIVTTGNYARKTPISFIKFSDAHKSEDVGKYFTWAKLKKLNFESLKTAFSNPTENISVIQPSISKILDDLIDLKNSFGVIDLSDDSIELISKYICALNNTEGGFILIGVSDRKNRIGIEIEEEDRNEEIDKLISRLKPCLDKLDLSKYENFDIRISPYTISNNRIILSLFIESSNKFISLKNFSSIFAIKDEKLTTLPVHELQSIVEERTATIIEKRIQRKITKIEKECTVIINYFCSLPLLKKIESSGINLFRTLEFHIEKCTVLNDSDINSSKKMNLNGTSRGNVSIFLERQPPRYEYACLRYSMPRFNLKSIPKNPKRVETIYAVPGGGVFWSNTEISLASDREIELLKFKSNNQSYSNKFITCFLKSSLCLWYCLNKHEDIDLYRQKIFEDLILPKISPANKPQQKMVANIESYFDDIIQLEKKFLVASRINKKDKEHLKLTERHNSAVDKKAYSIDQKIFELFRLSQDEVAIIENNLKANDIYLPKIVKGNGVKSTFESAD